MQNAKPVSTLLAAHFRLSSALYLQSNDDINYMSWVPYSSTVGSFIYAMVCSHLDLSYAVRYEKSCKRTLESSLVDFHILVWFYWCLFVFWEN